jgi:hypothetical protein
MEYTSKPQQADKNINNNDSQRNKDAKEAARTNTAGACEIPPSKRVYLCRMLYTLEYGNLWETILGYRTIGNGFIQAPLTLCMKKNRAPTGVYGTAIKADDQPECKTSDKACNGDSTAPNAVNQPQSQQAQSNAFREPHLSEPSPRKTHINGGMKWWNR